MTIRNVHSIKINVGSEIAITLTIRIVILDLKHLCLVSVRLILNSTNAIAVYNG